MENEEKMMTGEESLRIITEMLNKTRVNIRQGSFHLLLWGWMIVICSLAEYILDRFTNIVHPYYVWMLVIPGMFVSFVYGIITGRKAKMHTYADKIWMWAWMAFLISMLVAPIGWSIIFPSQLKTSGSRFFKEILSVILVSFLITIERLLKLCDKMGTKAIVSSDGSRIGPPPDKACAVEPVGVAMIIPSA